MKLEWCAQAMSFIESQLGAHELPFAMHHIYLPEEQRVPEVRHCTADANGAASDMVMRMLEHGGNPGTETSPETLHCNNTAILPPSNTNPV